MGLYAIASSTIKFPIGAGYVVPSYLVLVPMLLLLPPGVVPLLTAAGLVLGALGLALAGQGRAERVPLAVPDAWHSLGPTVVLLIAGPGHTGRRWSRSTSRPSSRAVWSTSAPRSCARRRSSASAPACRCA